MLSLRALFLVALVALFAASPVRAGLPTNTISDLQTCQAYAAQIQAGNIPADACSATTLATVSYFGCEGRQNLGMTTTGKRKSERQQKNSPLPFSLSKKLQ